MSTQTGRIIFLFVDGLGLGSPDPTINPLARRRYPAIEQLTGGAPLAVTAKEVLRDGLVFKGIDATLGLEGLPQSGTGQATLFTGINCAELAGRHYGPFPHSSSRRVIRERNLFSDAREISGTPPVFANAYPERFFRYVERTNRWTVTTMCCAAAGIPLRTGTDLEAGRAVSADITGRTWPEPGPNHRVIEPQEAGRRLTRLSDDSAFTVFEYFATDKAGHEQDFDLAEASLIRLDGLIEGILESLEAGRTLVVTSDHGNIENLSVRTHTRNAVPLAAYGAAARHFEGVDGLAAVRSAVVASLTPI